MGHLEISFVFLSQTLVKGSIIIIKKANKHIKEDPFLLGYVCLLLLVRFWDEIDSGMIFLSAAFWTVQKIF